VRVEGALGLMDALAKMTIMPARRLERRVPAMRDKGRIRVGADADITVFDPARILDRATFESPAEFSEGVVHVFVAGTPLVANGRLRDGSPPGRAIRAPVR
jgi:N-acyl-D-aspartate/D-glutamate deacylase